MKKFLSVILALAVFLTMSVLAFADSSEPIGKIKNDIKIAKQAKEAMMASLDAENLRLGREFSNDAMKTLPYDIVVKKAADSTNDGIHVATRRANAWNYNEIQTQFTLGTNIGAAEGASVYFMHYLGGSGVSVDSGIYYQNGAFNIFNYGTIIATSNWDSKTISGVSPGDTVNINSKITKSQIITDVIKNGIKIATLTNKLTTNKVQNVNVVREFNIASHYPIDNTDTYFSWSEAQSSMTTTGGTLQQMSGSNSKLDPVTYDNKTVKNRPNIKYDRTSRESGGFIYDRAWCRCNFG